MAIFRIILTMLCVSTVACVSFGGGYYTYGSTVEPEVVTKVVTKVVAKNVEVQEHFEKIQYITVYSDGYYEEISKPEDAKQEDLEYIITIEYSPNGYSYSVVEIHLLLSTGREVALGYSIPGAYKVSHKKFKPMAKTPKSDDGF